MRVIHFTLGATDGCSAASTLKLPSPEVLRGGGDGGGA
jgi:hypothetical protein